MPIDNTLQVTAATFPVGYCPRSNQQLANDISAGMRVTFTGTFTTIKSSTEPSVEYRGSIWIKTDATSGAVLGEFTFSSTYGIWLAYHWPFNIVPTGEKKLFGGSTIQLLSFDGGENAAITETTGPFWEVDTDWTDRFPMGASATVPVNTNVNVFHDTPTAAPSARGVYFIKPTARRYNRGT